MPRVDRRPLRPVLEGVHARAWSRGCSTSSTRDRPRRRFTIGITDDVSGTSLSYDAALDIEPPETVRAIFFGLGSDGTVGANKNTIKILGDEEGLNAQGYFVYDSKKSGSQTVSHLRFGPKPIRAPYLVQRAGFVGCHQFGLMEKADVLGAAADGATLLLNCAQPPDQVWDALSRPVQEQILAKRIELYAIDAGRIAREVGLAGRTNVILQTCFFAISGVLPREQAIERIKKAVAKTYGRRGAEVVERNQAAVDRALEGLERVEVPERVTATREPPPPVPADAPDFVRTVTAEMLAGRGDALPVSALPVDGTYPSGTTAYEKRNISELVAVWDADSCIQCGNCSFVCPHSVIRSRYYDESRLEGAPDGFRVGSSRRRRAARHPLHAAGLRRGLHRMRAVRRGMPGHRAGRPGAQGDQPRGARAARRGRARQHRVLRDAPGDGPLAGRLRHRARHAVPRAAVRVLRRLRGLRRDAVHQAAVAAVRRPADGRQRDRLLVDLRRKPADDALDDRRRRARPGLVELPFRGQRRVRARLPARRRPAHRARPAAAPRAARPPGREPGRRDPGSAPAAGVGAARTTRPGGRARAAARAGSKGRPSSTCGA